MKRRNVTVFILVLLVFLSGSAFAQDAALVSLRSEVLREVEEVNDKGEKETRLIPAPSAMPGEVLIFRIVYTNEGGDAAENVQLTNPVPEHMVYEEGSAKGEGATVTFSVDGGLTYDVPAVLTVVDENGKTRPAEPADYTHIQWKIGEPVPPGREGVVSFRARLR
jgi:uncharacterized repeat protein (TIGR01451 family)